MARDYPRRVYGSVQQGSQLQLCPTLIVAVRGGSQSGKGSTRMLEVELGEIVVEDAGLLSLGVDMVSAMLYLGDSGRGL